MNEQSLTKFSPEDIQSTQPAMKVGLLSTITPEGLPHVTMLSSLMAYSHTGLCFGQFTEGTSKKHILGNPKIGFMIMSLDKELWRGKASYSHFTKDGPEFDYYNNVPMFRYNAYFGVHTVYYLDLVFTIQCLIELVDKLQCSPLCLTPSNNSTPSMASMVYSHGAWNICSHIYYTSQEVILKHLQVRNELA